jgi:hypothetical protein
MIPAAATHFSTFTPFSADLKRPEKSKNPTTTVRSKRTVDYFVAENTHSRGL